MMKSLTINAPFSRIASAAGAAEKLIYERGYRPDVIATSSAATFLVLPLILGKMRQCLDLLVNLDEKDWYDKKPFDSRGRVSFNSLMKLFWGGSSLSSNKIVGKYVDDLVSQEGFDLYKSPDYPPVIVALNSVRSGKMRMFNLKDLDYSTYRNVVMASCANPLNIKPVKIGKEPMMDGSYNVSSVAAELFNKYNIVDSISIEVFENRGQQIDRISFKDVQDRSVQQGLFACQWVRTDISQRTALDLDINHITMILPQLQTSLYDTDPEKLIESYHSGGQHIDKELGDIYFWDQAQLKS